MPSKTDQFIVDFESPNSSNISTARWRLWFRGDLWTLPNWPRQFTSWHQRPGDHWAMIMGYDLERTDDIDTVREILEAKGFDSREHHYPTWIASKGFTSTLSEWVLIFTPKKPDEPPTNPSNEKWLKDYSAYYG